MSFLNASWADILITIVLGIIIVVHAERISQLKKRVKALEAK